MKLTNTDVIAIKIYSSEDGTIKVHQSRVSPCPLGFPAGCYWYRENRKCASLPVCQSGQFYCFKSRHKMILRIRHKVILQSRHRVILRNDLTLWTRQVICVNPSYQLVRTLVLIVVCREQLQLVMMSLCQIRGKLVPGTLFYQ